MKPKTIIGLLLLIGFSAVLLLNFGDEVGGYMNFAEATESGTHAHVVGTWVAEQHFEYDRQNNIFRFFMADEAGVVRPVHYPNPKPANFEDADNLVVQGYMKNGTFEAEHILVKCPSKYNDGREFETDPAAASSL